MRTQRSLEPHRRPWGAPGRPIKVGRRAGKDHTGTSTGGHWREGDFRGAHWYAPARERGDAVPLLVLPLW